MYVCTLCVFQSILLCINVIKSITFLPIFTRIFLPFQASSATTFLFCAITFQVIYMYYVLMICIHLCIYMYMYLHLSLGGIEIRGHVRTCTCTYIRIHIKSLPIFNLLLFQSHLSFDFGPSTRCISTSLSGHSIMMTT